MICVINIILNFIPAFCLYRSKRIILSICHSLLQCSKHFTHIHDNNVGSKTFGKFHMNWIIWHSELLSVEIIKAFQLLIRCKLSGSVRIPGKQLQWLCTLKVFCNIFPKFSLIAHSCVFYAVKQEWEIRDRHFRCFRPHGCSDYAHFHDSTFRIVICYLFASKYTGIINLDIITSIGRLFHHRFKHICQCLCGWCLI